MASLVFVHVISSKQEILECGCFIAILYIRPPRSYGQAAESCEHFMEHASTFLLLNVAAESCERSWWF